MRSVTVLKFSSLSGDSFILGTFSSKNEAHLLVYSIKESTGNGGSNLSIVLSHFTADLNVYECKLMKTLKKFTAKPITQVKPARSK